MYIYFGSEALPSKAFSKEILAIIMFLSGLSTAFLALCARKRQQIKNSVVELCSCLSAFS
jgi:hypothetical protein